MEIVIGYMYLCDNVREKGAIIKLNITKAFPILKRCMKIIKICIWEFLETFYVI